MRDDLNLKLLQDRTHVDSNREESPVFVQIEISPDENTKIKQVDHHWCLAIDCSTSMDGDKMEQAKTAAINLVRTLPSDDLVSIVTFESIAEEILAPKPAFERQYIESTINAIDIGRATDMYEGISLAFSKPIARVQQRSPDVINTMLLITDGDPTTGKTDVSDFVQLAKEVRDGGVSLDAVGIGDEYGQDEEHAQLLRQVAECGGGTWEHASDAEQVTKIVHTKYTARQKTVVNNPKLQLTLLDTAELVEMYTIKPTIDRIENLPRNGNVVSIDLKDILKDQDQAVVLELIIPSGNGTNLPLLRAAILEGDTEIASKSIEISYSTDKVLCKRVNQNVFWAFYSMKGTVKQRDGIDDPDAKKEGDKIAKTLPHPDDPILRGLGQETVKHLTKISGKDPGTISKSDKTKLKHDTTFIDDRDN
ncbi:MAG: VWA domain-containing protein [Gammaproteobacteria bacterium]|nr:VWA domain-containing protein [Gammaproteobacteria bacterium]